MTDKKTTIVMPVGEKAGKKVSVTETEAKNLESIFGKYEDPKKATDGLEAKISKLEDANADLHQKLTDSQTNLETAEDKIIELQKMLDKASNDNENGDTQK